jgi:hypothetical protein
LSKSETVRVAAMRTTLQESRQQLRTVAQRRAADAAVLRAHARVPMFNRLERMRSASYCCFVAAHPLTFSAAASDTHGPEIA